MKKISIDNVTDTLLVHLDGPVATLTLNRPGALNAINHEQRTNLLNALQALDANDDVRALVLTGAGRSFCAGQDQKESAAMDAQGAHRRIEAYATLYTAMRKVRKPIVARMHGYATGAGLQLALLSDLRIADRSCRVGMTEFNVGSAAIMGSAFLLPVIGEAAMRRLVMLSDFVAPEEALRMGLLTEVHEEERLDARIQDIAAGLAARAPLGVALTKEWWRIMGDDLFEAAMAHARQAHARNFASGGFSAGAARFVGRKGA